ncbi:MAG: 2OG-Fe(II) oxygenase [Candidatus Baltobacteraceae bacterium]
MSVLHYERLENQRIELRVRFDAADPIRHLVLDDFLKPAAAQHALAAFPSPQAMEIAFAGLPEVKNAEQRIELLDPVFQDIFRDLRSPRFITWLQSVTGIDDLSADPELHGGGLHQGSDGSYLDVHADFNIHPRLGLYRRLNVLIYLNPIWQSDWQGYLELWSRDMQECRQYIEPKFNRCVIMETHDHAFHGYKELRLPAGVTRKSIASYYYSASRSQAQTESEHDTLFQLRPEQQQATGMRLFFRRLTALSPPKLRPAVRAVRKLFGLDT